MQNLFNKIAATLFFLIVYQFLPVYGSNTVKDTIPAFSTDTISVRTYDDAGLNSADTDILTAPASAVLLSEYVSIESVTGNERDAGMFLAETCKSMGLYVELFTNEKDTFNFAASLYPLDMNKPNIILLNHIDVVPADAPDLWTHPPFSGAIEDGYIWGRGSIDNKGMAIMQLMAMEKFVEKARIKDLPYNITLLSVSGEETGGYTGAKVVTEDFLDKLNAVVVYGEGGTGLPGVISSDPDRKLFGISVASKRLLWIKLTLSMETAGHGSVPPVSYAVQEKIDALNRVTWRNNNRIIRFSETTYNMFNELGKLETGFIGTALRNIRLFRPLVIPVMKREEIIYSLISNTVTVTGITTQPGPPNQIPQEITSVLDCRLLPETSTDEFIRKIKSWLNNDNIKVEIIRESTVAKPTQVDEYYYMMSDALKHVFHNAGVIPILAPASNDNNYFRAKGIPTYGILTVFMSIELLESIHNVDERLPVEALEDGVGVYTELIRLFLEGELNN